MLNTWLSSLQFAAFTSHLIGAVCCFCFLQASDGWEGSHPSLNSPVNLKIRIFLTSLFPFISVCLKKTRDVARCLVNVILLPALQRLVTLHRGLGQVFVLSTAVTHPQEKSWEVCVRCRQSGLGQNEMWWISYPRRYRNSHVGINPSHPCAVSSPVIFC